MDHSQSVLGKLLHLFDAGAVSPNHRSKHIEGHKSPRDALLKKRTARKIAKASRIRNRSK